MLSPKCKVSKQAVKGELKRAELTIISMVKVEVPYFPGRIPSAVARAAGT